MEKLAASLAFSTLLLSAASACIDPNIKIPEADKEQVKYYSREEIPLPKGQVMEIGSIALMPDKEIAVATRRGEIWICSGVYAKDLTKVTWRKIFSAAHEPLGMFAKDGWLYFTDRDAFARIADTDNDGRYESYQVVNNSWGINGDYHEYNFGSTPDKNGDVWIVHCLTGSINAKSKWRGWAQRIDKNGKATPVVSGIRSPGGIGFNYQGDAFYSDNQGFWNGTSCIKHLKPGHFTGNPEGNIFYKDAPHMGAAPKAPVSGSRIEDERKRNPKFVPPSVLIPHGKVGQSPTGLITDLTKGNFGPFATQMLVGEQTHSQVQRVQLEQVNGVYQGAVWKFLNGFRCGIVPMRLSSDGSLFVGGTNRGWASVGGKTFSLERVRWTGKVPFEMKSINVTPKGFKMTFTEPLDEKLAVDPNTYLCRAWTYIYQKSYGSPEVDKVALKITGVQLSNDKKSVTVNFNKLIKGHVHHIHCDKLKSASGKKVWHPNVYYTLNEIPKK